MPLTAAMATSYKNELFQGVHLAADTYKIALIKVGATGTYDATMTNVGTPGSGAPSTSNLGTDEVTGAGYTSGGATLAGFTTSQSGTTAWLDFTVDPTWAASTISAIGAIIYNSTKSGKVAAVLDFGGTITSTNGTFTVTLPAAAAATALLRIA